MLVVGLGSAGVDLNDALAPERNHPAIGYEARPPSDVVAGLNRRLQSGTASLNFDSRRSVSAFSPEGPRRRSGVSNRRLLEDQPPDRADRAAQSARDLL